MDAQLRLIPRSQASTPEVAPATTAGAFAPHRRADASTTSTDRSPARVEPDEAPIQWRIDDSARERGRAGISRAREALSQARRPLPDHGHTTAA